MNLKKFLRFFVVQNLVFLINLRFVRNVQAFSFPENSKPLFQANEQFAIIPLVANQRFAMAFTGAKNLFVSLNLGQIFGNFSIGNDLQQIKLEGFLSKMETLLSPLAFSLLLFLMLAYWSQAAFFGQEKYKTFNNFIFFLAIASLTLLLSFRWVISRHFPLSNLYESLIFLSLCFLSLKALFLPTTKLSQKTKVLPNQVFDVDAFGIWNLEFGGAKKEPKKSQKEAKSPLVLSTSVLPTLVLPKTNTKFVKPAQGQIFDLQQNRIVNSLGQPLQNNALYKRHAGQNQNPEISLQIEESVSRSSNTEKAPDFSNNQARDTKADFLALSLGVILSPLSLLTFGFAFLSLPKEMQQSTALVPALQSNWLMMHVTVMILSYAALISGSILAIAFLILSYFQSSSTVDDPIFFDKVNLEQDIRSQVETVVTKVEYSSLTIRLDNYSYRILALGFPLLTIGILSGAVWANEAWGSYWSWDPKETWALITWLVFAIYLHTRITKGWSGKKPAIVASAGFFMVWFCYLGVNLLGTGLHSYGWFTKTFTG